MRDSRSLLILVKHSLPEIVPDVPAAEWRLSEDGRNRCRVLADRLAAYAPNAIVASRESKAQETAEIVALDLGCPLEVGEGLHEHERPDAVFQDRQQFEETVARLFAQPATLVFGRETADRAWARFSAAVARAADRHPVKTLVIVAHGTVISLFVSRALDLEPFPLWKRLGLPSFIVLSRPDYHLLSLVEDCNVGSIPLD